MYPALSVIFFTTLSGAGFGLLLWLCVALMGHQAEGLSLWHALVIASLLTVLGLGASTLHLRHPERAWRALSQWRTSWLSREGVSAIAALAALGGLWLSLLAGPALAVQISAGVLLVLSLGTTLCTAKIYNTLKPVSEWHHPLVTPLYFLFALSTGGWLWLSSVGIYVAVEPATLALVATVTVITWLVKLVYWRDVDNGLGTSTVASATGLKGAVTPLEPPHTEPNYLIKEMGFRVAQRHSQRLRNAALFFGLGIPLAVAGLAALLPGAGVVLILGSASILVGTFLERWLFFAEAKHTSMLYY